MIAQRGKEIREVECVVKQKDAMIRDLQLELVQQRGVIQQLQMIAQGVASSRNENVMGKDERADKQVVKSEEKIMKARTTEAEMTQERVRGADTMMELIREMRDSRREAYDPL